MDAHPAASVAVRRELRRCIDERAPEARRLLVALSGGMDSCVLLHAASRIGFDPSRLVALHADHGLCDESAAWSRHCRELCRALGVECVARRLDPAELVGRGPEDAARNARYAWFESLMQKGDALLFAHHRGDQAETVLANLFRGAGVDGLAAMPRSRAFGRGVLLRPFLDLDRSLLRAYAVENALDWIDDPSNARLRHDRNRIRHRILPTIRRRWENVDARIARAAENLSEARSLLAEVARADLRRVAVEDAFQPLSDAPVLDVDKWLELSPARQLNCLRGWIGLVAPRLPARARLLRLQRDILDAPRSPSRFAWDAWEVRRYRARLYVNPAVPDLERRARAWDLREPLPVEGADLEVVAEWPDGARPDDPRAVTVDWRNGSKRVRFRERRGSRPLRKVFQERGVPPWLRPLLPRILVDGRVAAVPGVIEPHSIAGSERLPRFRLRRRARRDP